MLALSLFLSIFVSLFRLGPSEADPLGDILGDNAALLDAMGGLSFVLPRVHAEETTASSASANAAVPIAVAAAQFCCSHSFLPPAVLGPMASLVWDGTLSTVLD